MKLILIIAIMVVQNNLLWCNYSYIDVIFYHTIIGSNGCTITYTKFISFKLKLLELYENFIFLYLCRIELFNLYFAFKRFFTLTFVLVAKNLQIYQ